MAENKHVEVLEFSQSMARHINGLGDESKITRRKSIEAIRREFQASSAKFSKVEFQELFDEFLKPLLKILSDPIEKCRELTILLIFESVDSLARPQDILHLLIPVIVQRLGQQEINEPSEELRLELVKCLTKLIEISGKSVSMFLDDLIKILQQTIVDPYPEVKKESCKCASKLARSIPESFHQQSESLIKPLCESISHQHSRVRIEVILSIGKLQHPSENRVKLLKSLIFRRRYSIRKQQAGG